jgi:hypothetical protein
VNKFFCVKEVKSSRALSNFLDEEPVFVISVDINTEVTLTSARNPENGQAVNIGKLEGYIRNKDNNISLLTDTYELLIKQNIDINSGSKAFNNDYIPF